MKLTLGLNDVGIPVRLTVVDSLQQPINISAATTKEYRFLKPSGAKIAVAATFITNGVDGKLTAKTPSGLCDQEGDFKVQVHVVIPPDEDWGTTAIDFDVVDFLTKKV